MPQPPSSRTPLEGKRAFWLLAALLIVLWFAGGASRSDAPGQIIARAAAWLTAIFAILWDLRPSLRAVAPIPALLFLSIALLAVQLIPLPPSIWTELPARDVLAHSADLTGGPQPWRPLSLSPGGTRNALSSLIVPLMCLILASRLPSDRQWQLVTLILGLVFAASLLGIFEFSGAAFDHPLVNDLPGHVSGSFANRNHFALFGAIGCAIAPMWSFRSQKSPVWMISAAIGLVIIFVLMILASGSRLGMLVAAMALALGCLGVRREIGRGLRRISKKASVAIVASSAGLLILAVAVSVSFDRAVSVERAGSLQSGDDLRMQALPTVLEMTAKYFPIGTGYGTFDPAFRIDEPPSMLKPTYFNLAHNDLLQVVLEGGLLGLALLLTALSWWAWASWRAWRSGGLLAKLGSTIILLTILASAADYPARTPMIMAIVAVASVWLAKFAVSEAGPRSSARRTPLPD